MHNCSGFIVIGTTHETGIPTGNMVFPQHHILQGYLMLHLAFHVQERNAHLILTIPMRILLRKSQSYYPKKIVQYLRKERMT